MRIEPDPTREPRTWFHLTNPYNSDGSAMHHVIRELGKETEARGGTWKVLCAATRDYTFAERNLLPIDYSQYLSREYLTEREQKLDHAAGALGLTRPWVGRAYRPAVEALRGVEGPVFAHKGHLGENFALQMKRAEAGVPTYLYFHSHASRGYRPRELARTLDAAAGVVCVSDFVREQLEARLGRHRITTPMFTVLNGVDADRFHPPDHRGPDRKLRVLFIGVMIAEKGPHVLLDALARMGPVSDYEVLLVGSREHVSDASISEYEHQLRAIARQVGGDVRFMPYQSHEKVPALYRSADVLVVPSQFEDPCPLVVLEGLASGLAVVGTRRGGIAELGASAMQYFDTADELAPVLRELILDADARQNWQTRARVRASELSWARTFEELSEIVAS